MMKLLWICVLAIAGTYTSATFAAGPAFQPTIQDSGFKYYGAKKAYLTMIDENDNVIVRVSQAPTNGALPMSFDKIDALSTTKYRDLYGGDTSLTMIDQVEARSDEQTRLHELAGMSTLDNGWSVEFNNTSLADAIAAYTNWFGGSGLDMVADTSHSTVNVKAFTASGQGDPLRIVFRHHGKGVRVYIGPS